MRWFVVSNFRPSLLGAVQSAVKFPLVVNQVEISLIQRQSFEDGVLDQCLENQIIPLSWSPLAQGRLGDAHQANGDAHLSWMLHALDQEAAALGLSRAGAAISWLLAHPSKIVPIVGSTHPDRLSQMVKALDCPMGRNAWYRLFTAARGQRLP